MAEPFEYRCTQQNVPLLRSVPEGSHAGLHKCKSRQLTYHQNVAAASHLNRL